MNQTIATCHVSDDDEFCGVILPVVAAVLTVVEQSESSGMLVVHRRIDWDTHAERLLLEGEFKQYYRMSYAGFERLLTLVGADLAVDPLQSARRALGEPPVSPAGMLQTCISWLAGGSYHHIRVITGTSRAGFYRIVHAVLAAINNCRSLAILFHLTNDEMELAADGFRPISTNGAIPGCIGAIYGWLCPIRVPRSSECGRVVSFFSGHYQRYGLNVQACADHLCRFTAMACRAPGGRSDSVAFLQWSLSNLLSKIQGPYFVVADNAYTQSRTVLTPFNQAQLNNRPDRDNFYMSYQNRDGVWSTSQQVEDPEATTLCFTQARTDVIHACMRLHNFCVEQRIMEGPASARSTVKSMRKELRTWNQCRDLSYTHAEFEAEGGEVIQLLDEATRTIIVQHIAANDLHRPAYNIAREAKDKS